MIAGTMGRPATYTTGALVAHAADVFATGGARALTMSAVARAAGAPSGSVYHRFPDRPALLAAVWLYAVEEFQNGYLRELGDEPSTADAVRTSEWIVDWCRDHLGLAAVLQAGVQTFEPDAWSAQARRELGRLQERQAHELTALGQRISGSTGLPADQVLFVLMDLPLAAVRPHLLAGRPPPLRTRTMVRDLVRAVLIR